MAGLAGEGGDWLNIPNGMTGKGKCHCMTTAGRQAASIEKPSENTESNLCRESTLFVFGSRAK
eukprot:11004565-Ditylum_brightwellii.AAC.1